jgi:hypothetical protein
MLGKPHSRSDNHITWESQQLGVCNNTSQTATAIGKFPLFVKIFVLSVAGIPVIQFMLPAGF